MRSSPRGRLGGIFFTIGSKGLGIYRIYTVGTYIYIYSSKVIPISLDRQLAVSTGHLCRERLFLRLWDGSPLYPLTQKISGHLAELSRFL